MKVAPYLAATLVATAIGVGSWFALSYRPPAELAPSVTYTLLDGRTASIAGLRGKVALVNFLGNELRRVPARNAADRRHP